MTKRVRFDTLRSIAFGAISGTYAPIGADAATAKILVNAKILTITNGTNAPMIVSDDPDNVSGKLIILPLSAKLFDLTSNLNVGKDDDFAFGAQTTLYVKQVSAPGSGSVYVEVVYG